MIDYRVIAAALFALAFLSVIWLCGVAYIEHRRKRRKIVPDPQPDRWYCEYTRGPNGEV